MKDVEDQLGHNLDKADENYSRLDYFFMMFPRVALNQMVIHTNEQLIKSEKRQTAVGE